MIDVIKDPQTYAKTYADSYIARANALLKKQIDRNSVYSSGLKALDDALKAFRKANEELVKGDSVTRNSVWLSNDAIAKATAAPNAKPGAYDFYVKQLATANQRVVDLPASIKTEGAGSFEITLNDGTTCRVDIEALGKDGKEALTPEELARAINGNRELDGKVRAEVVGGKLVLTSAETGEQNGFTIDASGLNDPDLKQAFESAKETSKAQDAIILLGGENGVEIEQPSNVLNSIEGLTITFNKTGAVTVKVSADKEETVKGVRAFVDAYNALMDEFEKLTRAGNEKNNEAGGPLEADAGVRALISQIKNTLRKSVDGVRLHELGIETDRKGRLSINESALDKALKDSPEKLDKLFGNKSTGLVGNFDALLDTWLDASKGQMKKRMESVEHNEKKLDAQSDDLKRRYDRVYDQYVKQFTALQALQANLESTLTRLNDLFSTKNN
ncbi:flagellar filament capping protein FliD [Burkholderia mayonis]|uniref:flagellar filament capping protein FliD n=1 Tax=Burkholderia mayonis TaxID=1385591 RepID=UPI000AB2775D|nr:flagellar filament capping protein FliD [Burkholderia mayonis]